MIVWLDHKIFGNGYGLGSPFWDNVFYWLDGEIYTWIGGFGAQLQSFQWRHPRAGERRLLCGREFVVFNSRRRCIRVCVSWCMVGLDGLPIDDASAAIRELRTDLGRRLLAKGERLPPLRPKAVA